MLYVYRVTIPKNRLQNNPVEQKILLAHGIITWVSVAFPAGCAGLAHCAIFHHEHQIFPSRSDEDFAGDSFPIEWTDYYEMYERPYDLLARFWNEDDTYPHTVTIRLAVLPRKAIIVYQIADAIKSIIGSLSPKRIFTAEK